jgi:hypothetical protein
MGWGADHFYSSSRRLGNNYQLFPNVVTARLHIMVMVNINYRLRTIIVTVTKCDGPYLGIGELRPRRKRARTAVEMSYNLS